MKSETVFSFLLYVLRRRTLCLKADWNDPIERGKSPEGIP